MADTTKNAEMGIILAKLHVTSADPVPTPEANAILVLDPKIDPVFRKIPKNTGRLFMGAQQQYNIGEALKISFKTEVKGSGAAGTAPPIGPLLRASNYTETIVASTSVAYDPNSLRDSAAEVAIYYYQDGRLFKALRCKGTGVLEAKAGDPAFISWDFTGIYAGPATVANVTPDLSGEINPPRFVSAGFAVDSVAQVIDTLKITLGNEIAKRPSANAASGVEQFLTKDRKLSAAIAPEVTTLVPASLTTALTGVNNDLVFTAHANYPGVDGNVITIEYEGGETAGSETCVVTGTHIVVGVDLVAPGSTAAQVKTKVEATPAAMLLLASVAHAPANDGSGEVTVLAETLLAGGLGVDFWKRNIDSALLALTATIGSVAGNICTITAPAAQIDTLKTGSRENILTDEMTLNLVPTDAGNDEIKFFFT